MISNYFHKQIETERKIEMKIIIIVMPREKRKDEAVSNGRQFAFLLSVRISHDREAQSSL